MTRRPGLATFPVCIHNQEVTPMLKGRPLMNVFQLKDKGRGIREIARVSGHSRNSVRKYVRDSATPNDTSRKPRGSKLDAHKNEVRRLLDLWTTHRLARRVHSRSATTGNTRTTMALTETQVPAIAQPLTDLAGQTRGPDSYQGRTRNRGPLTLTPTWLRNRTARSSSACGQTSSPPSPKAVPPGLRSSRSASPKPACWW